MIFVVRLQHSCLSRVLRKRSPLAWLLPRSSRGYRDEGNRRLMKTNDMNQEDAKAVLKRAFSSLSDEELQNLRHHLKRETPVWSGSSEVKKLYFSTESGFG